MSYQFENDAFQIIEISDTAGDSIVDVMTMIASMMSSSAMRANATFPAYTLPDFAILGETSFDLSGAVDMIYAPLVRNALPAFGDEESGFRISEEWRIRHGEACEPAHSGGLGGSGSC